MLLTLGGARPIEIEDIDASRPAENRTRLDDRVPIDGALGTSEDSLDVLQPAPPPVMIARGEDFDSG
jgi:hypothetical protein